MHPSSPVFECHLLMTGNELMAGNTVDSNSSFIAEQLGEIGISVKKKITIGDNFNDLVNEITLASDHVSLLIINGGLGPTIDDLTAQALARVCNKPLCTHPEAEQHVRQWCDKRGASANDSNLKQALLPSGAEIIANPIGSAVGIRMQHKNCLILCTPGVPIEMRAMVKNEIIPLLKTRFPESQQRFIRRLQVFGMGESSIQNKINNEYPNWPSKVELGFRAGISSLELKLVVGNKSDLPLRDIWEGKLKDLLGEHVFGENNDSLSSTVVRLLDERKKTLTTAESCTGGLIASMVTSISGASKVFNAGFVTYSNQTKTSLLGVAKRTLDVDGAVSEAVVTEMAKGALQKTGSDYVIAVSGIAGPDGGTIDKPVGTAWIAWGTAEKIKTHKVHYPSERIIFQNVIASYGLDLIRRELLGSNNQPNYLRSRQQK